VSSCMPEARRTCGDCARFKVPDAGCDMANHIQEGTILASDLACDNFFPAKKTKEKKQKKKKLLKDSGCTGSGCFEAIYHDEEPAFIVLSSGDFSVSKSIEIGEEPFSPKEVKHIPYEPYGYFEDQVASTEDLFCRVRNEFKTFVDVDSIWKSVLGACVLLSYQQEKLHTVPYIFLFGDNESGKSTVLQLLKLLCYRPMYGVTVPAADIYGYLEDSDGIGCILEDEVQGINRDTDKIKIYKAGYKRGAVVPRTIVTSFDRIIKFYRAFCFKACASEQIPQIKGFRERFIEIPMVEGFPEKEWADITKDDLKRLHDLRNMLLKWRMLTRENDLPEVELNMKGRLKELWKPLLQIAHSLAVYDELFKFAEAQKSERLSARQDSLEGHIVKVVVNICNREAGNLNLQIPFQTVWNELTTDLDGKIDDKKPHAMETSEFFTVTKNKVGYRLREVLSGKTQVLREKDSRGNWKSTKVYVFDFEKLKRIAKKYGHELVTKLPTLLSSNSVEPTENMKEPMEKDVEIESCTPLEVGKLGNSVTALAVPRSNIQTIALSTVKLHRLTGIFPDVCFGCGFSGRMSWHVDFYDGSWKLVCEQCGFQVQKLRCEQS
jgi:hypothetical protein